MNKATLFSAVFAVLGIISAPLSASVLPEQLEQWADWSERVEFTQHKQIKGLSRPLVSQGYMQLSKDQLLWHTQKPVDQQVLVKATGVSQWSSGEFKAVAGTEMIGQLMLAVVQKNTSFLLQYFDAKTGQPDCIELTPNQAPVNQFFSQIILCGQQQLQSIQLNEVSGSQTLIHLIADGTR